MTFSLHEAKRMSNLRVPGLELQECEPTIT
jgi:hypothetical protein